MHWLMTAHQGLSVVKFDPERKENQRQQFESLKYCTKDAVKCIQHHRMKCLVVWWLSGFFSFSLSIFNFVPQSLLLIPVPQIPKQPRSNTHNL